MDALSQVEEVDLHILVVPDSQWRPDLRLAYSNTCMASVSSGFVRVGPDTTLDGLRTEISKQLDSLSVPQSFIFLRNVGRHLCTVSRSQELTLTSKHFAPPLAVCPEIYLLNAHLTDVMYDQRTAEDMLHHRKQLYSPHTSGDQLFPSPHLTSTPTASHHHSLHQLHNNHRQRSVVSDKATHQTDTQRNLSKLSEESGETAVASVGRDHHMRSSLSSATPDVADLKTEQSQYPSSLHYYQPQDQSRGHTSLLFTSEAQHTPNVDHYSERLQPAGNTHPVKGKSRNLHKVHFESSEHDSMTSFSSMSDVARHSLSSQDHIHFLIDSASFSSSSPHDSPPGSNTKSQGRKESLSSAVRKLQQKIKTSKEKGDSEWKQKLTHEKKQTRTLEKSIRKLTAEVEAVEKSGATTKQHARKAIADSDHRRDSRSVPKSESNHTNMKLECKRADLDMENMRKTLEDEKQKLKLEQERHRSITDECKLLKKELVQLKIAHNRDKK